MDLHNKVQGKFFDKDFRKKLRANPKQVLFDAKVKVVTNTKDTIYVVIPSQKIPIEALGGVSAAEIANLSKRDQMLITSPDLYEAYKASGWVYHCF